MFTQALSREVGSRGITVTSPAGSDRHGFESGGRLACHRSRDGVDRYGRVEEVARGGFVAAGVSIHGANLTVDRMNA